MQRSTLISGFSLSVVARSQGKPSLLLHLEPIWVDSHNHEGLRQHTVVPRTVVTAFKADRRSLLDFRLVEKALSPVAFSILQLCSRATADRIAAINILLGNTRAMGFDLTPTPTHGPSLSCVPGCLNVTTGGSNAGLQPFGTLVSQGSCSF